MTFSATVQASVFAQSKCECTCTCMHAYTQMHMHGNKCAYSNPLGTICTDVHTQLPTHSKRNASAPSPHARITSQWLLSLRWHCSFSLITKPHYACMWPQSDFTRSWTLRSLTSCSSVTALRDQGSAASHIPSQLCIYRVPIYNRLLMATLTNFTGRQSNMASLWGHRGCLCNNLQNILRWTFSEQAGEHENKRKIEGRNGREQAPCKESGNQT